MTRTIHNMRRFLTRTGTLVALLAVVVVLGFSVGRVFVRQASFYREIAALEAERDRLSSDNRSFERQLVFVSSEAFFGTGGTRIVFTKASGGNGDLH